MRFLLLQDLLLEYVFTAAAVKRRLAAVKCFPVLYRSKHLFSGPLEILSSYRSNSKTEFRWGMGSVAT